MRVLIMKLRFTFVKKGTREPYTIYSVTDETDPNKIVIRTELKRLCRRIAVKMNKRSQEVFAVFSRDFKSLEVMKDPEAKK